MWFGDPFNMRLQPAILCFMAIAFGGLRAEPCTTPGCLEIAKVFHDSMDLSVHPCENFYQFTCGNFIKKAVIPDWKEEYSVQSGVKDNIHQQLKHELEAETLSGQPPSFQKAKDYYHSCMDTESIEKYSIINMKKRLDSYGGWPVLEDSWNDDDFDWLNTTEKMLIDGQLTDQIISVGVEFIDDGHTNWTIVIDYGMHYLDDDSLREGMENTYVQKYLEVIVDFAVAFGANREQAEKDMAEVIQLEIAMVNLSYLPVELPKIPQTISELQEVWPYIPWLDYIRRIFIIDVGITDSSNVKVLAPHYLAKLQNMLPKISKRTLANYIMSRAIFESRYHLNQEIFNIAWRLHNINGEEISLPPRWEYCIEDLIDNTAVTLAAMYVRKYFDPDIKKEAEKIVDMLQDHFVDIIANESWLSEETKMRSINKVKNIKDDIGYPEELLNDTLLNKYHEGLNTTPRSYYDNYLAFLIWWSILDAKKLRSPADPASWEFLPYDQTMSVESMYLVHSNSLVLYSGQLQPLFFSADRPMYVNLGIMGSMAAQELPSALDDYARRVYENGNLEDLWDESSANEYDKRAQALADEYSSYVVKEVNMTLDGDYFVYTVIGDQGGNKIARTALDTWITLSGLKEPKLKGLEQYSEAQVFWLGVALNYCSKSRLDWTRREIENDDSPPDEFRVNGPFRQSEQFAKDWECPVGSYMNPEVKVNMW